MRRDGWRIVTFGDVAKQLKEDADPESGEVERYVAGEHMITDDLRIRSWGTIGDGYLGPAFHRRFRPGQILYGSRRTYLRKVAVADFDGICANTTFVIEPKTDVIEPDLLPFIMQSEGFSEHSVRNSKGSVNPYVNWKDIASYEFPLPPLDEQRRIAEILWAVEEAIEGWVQAVLATMNLRQAIVAQYLQSPNIKSVPENVVIGTFSSLAHIDQLKQKDLDDDDDVSFLAMADISDEGRIINIWTRKYSEVKQGYTYFEEGDILFAKITPCLENGKGAIAVGLTNGIGFGSTEFFVLKPKIETDRQFVYQLSQNPLLRRRAEAFMQGSAGQKRLPRSFFFNFRLLLPPVSQRKIVGDQLASLDARIDIQKNQINNLKRLKSSYMEQIWEQVDVQ